MAVNNALAQFSEAVSRLKGSQFNFLSFFLTEMSKRIPARYRQKLEYYISPSRKIEFNIVLSEKTDRSINMAVTIEDHCAIVLIRDYDERSLDWIKPADAPFVRDEKDRVRSLDHRTGKVVLAPFTQFGFFDDPMLGGYDIAINRPVMEAMIQRLHAIFKEWRDTAVSRD